MTKINPNYPKKDLKTFYVSLPVKEANSLKAQIKIKCGWSRAVWYNKFHNITKLTLSEIYIISNIADKEPEQLFDLDTNTKYILHDDAN
jgi:hypothetical protein